MVRLLKAAILGAAGYVAWKFLRDTTPSMPETLKQGSEGASVGGPSASKPAASSGDSNGSGDTKAELYERAKQLGIEGRSKMSKQDLERAIRDAG